jgi:hypothetical protein
VLLHVHEQVDQGPPVMRHGGSQATRRFFELHLETYRVIARRLDVGGREISVLGGGEPRDRTSVHYPAASCSAVLR